MVDKYELLVEKSNNKKMREDCKACVFGNHDFCGYIRCTATARDDLTQIFFVLGEMDENI